jgi:hypothetical protein
MRERKNNTNWGKEVRMKEEEVFEKRENKDRG